MVAIVLFNGGATVEVEFDAWNRNPIEEVLQDQKTRNLIVDYRIVERV